MFLCPLLFEELLCIWLFLILCLLLELFLRLLGLLVLLLLPFFLLRFLWRRVIGQVFIVVKDAVLVLAGLEPEEALNAQHLVLLKHIQVLAHDVYEDLLQLTLHALYLSFSGCKGSTLVDTFHEMVVHMALIHYLLEDKHVLKLEKYPGSSDLIHDTLEKGYHTLQEERILLVVLIFDYLQVLAYNSIVNKDRYLRDEVELSLHEFLRHLIITVLDAHLFLNGINIFKLVSPIRVELFIITLLRFLIFLNLLFLLCLYSKHLPLGVLL